MAVAKSNAYGHGILDYPKYMEALGVDWIGVDSAVEGFKLRKIGVKIPILVLGYTLPANYKKSARENISLTISHKEHLSEILKLNTKDQSKIHIKIDTGMHRQGFLPHELPDVIRILKENKFIKLEGIYTHFAQAKNPSDDFFTNQQINKFGQVIRVFKDAGFSPLTHASATGATILYPKAKYDMARVGIGLMGHYPSQEISKEFGDSLDLHPSLSWKSIISEIKEIPKGEPVGYDLSETVTRTTTIGIVPIGYWHGYRRSLSSTGYVLINGQQAKVLGRVSMDMITVDLTDINRVKIGNEVVLIGKSGSEEITAEELATICGTTSYEILTQLNPLIKRVYI